VSTVGLASQSLVLAAFVHLVLAYPAGRLATRLDRLIVVCGYTLAVVANVLTLMFDPHPACAKCTHERHLRRGQARRRRGQWTLVRTSSRRF